MKIIFDEIGMKKKGFTLIELLVVIAIIALLLSIMVPALSKAKEYSKRMTCMSNARQAGLGLKVYSQTYNDQLNPMRNQNGVVTDNPNPWEAVVAFSPTYTDSTGKPRGMHLGVLYKLGLIENPEVFYCPAQPRVSEYPIPYYYDFYTSQGEWGTFFPQPPGLTGHLWVRTSYNYWTYNEKKVTKLHASQPILVDNLQEWEVIPHRKSRISPSLSPGVPNPNAVPQGVTALFADGHVNFCVGDDIFDKSIWPLQAGYYNGPGNNRDSFLKIMRVIQGHQ